MKKIVALVLASLMVLSLAACASPAQQAAEAVEEAVAEAAVEEVAEEDNSHLAFKNTLKG